MIPLVNLNLQYNTIKSEINRAIKDVINKSAFIKGEYVDKFERKFSKALNSKYCISCGNGTDALYITLKSLGIGNGDEVITVANSWISTSESITQTGARVVFADIEPDYYTISTNEILKKITKKTKAIIPVHLFGQSSSIKEIIKIAKSYNLFVIEDCAQSHFGEYNKKKLGTFGIAGTFSFYPGKNLGAFGDAGAIVTNNKEFAIEARKYANHGSLKKHIHLIEGINSRMDGIQAAIIDVKLKYINKWNKKRMKNSFIYNKLLLKNASIITPTIRKNSKHVFHLYVIRLKKRDELIKYLKKHKISTGIHYPTPLPFLKAYKYLDHKPSHFPVSWSYKDQILSLPMFPELNISQIKFICKLINEF